MQTAIPRVITMNALLILVASTALGIEVGWEPLPGGGHEYTIQLEPQLLKVMESGQEEIFSEVPEGVDVRRYRIVVGVGKLRRDYGPLAAEIESPPAAAQQDPAAAAPSFAPPARAETPAYEEPPPAANPYAAQPSQSEPDPQGLDPLPEERNTTAPEFGNPAAPEFPAATPEFPQDNQPSETQTTPVADPWAESAKSENVSEGQADQWVVEPPPAVAKGQEAPGKLPSNEAASEPIRQATFENGKSSDVEGIRDTGRPEIPEPEPDRPWFALWAAIFLLGCSLGGNIFLSLVARDARNRYRSTVERFRGAPA